MRSLPHRHAALLYRSMKLPNIFEADTPPVNFAAGDIVFSSGDSGTDMYVVKSGEVELRVGGKAVEVVQEDGFFGEMALIEEGPRTATAVAKTTCSLIPINEQRFEFMALQFLGLPAEFADRDDPHRTGTAQPAGGVFRAALASLIGIEQQADLPAAACRLPQQRLLAP